MRLVLFDRWKEESLANYLWVPEFLDYTDEVEEVGLGTTLSNGDGSSEGGLVSWIEGNDGGEELDGDKFGECIPTE